MKKYIKFLSKVINSGNKGFTLIELLIVMIIIGLLSALVGPKMFNKVKKSRVQATKAQIYLLETALDTYRLDNYRYPTELQALVRNPGEDTWDGPYLKKIPKDAWGNEYSYQSNDEDFFIIASAGPDGEPGSEDDISNQEDEGASTGDVVGPGW